MINFTKRPQGSCPPSARCFTATLAPQPIDRGVNVVGQVIKPWYRHTRKRTVNEAIRRVQQAPAADVFQTSNSYFGLLGQASASHHDRTRLANAIRARGYTINQAITKTYRKKH